VQRLPARLTAISAAATATATAVPAATATTGRTRTRFIHVQRAAVQFGAIQARDGRLGFIGIGHFHEGKTTRLARRPVGYDTDTFYGAVLREGLMQVLLRRPEIEISYENIGHWELVSYSNLSLKTPGCKVNQSEWRQTQGQDGCGQKTTSAYHGI
jgi:hypothetical protein